MLGLVQTIVLLAATAHGVDPQRMLGVARCESGFDRYAVNGPYRGLYQLDGGNQAGLRRMALRSGIQPDIYDPSQQANYAAEVIAAGGGPSNWGGTWRCYGPGQLLR